MGSPQWSFSMIIKIGPKEGGEEIPGKIEGSLHAG